MTTVQFKDWRCRLYLASYSDGNTALSMYDTEDGSAIACVTVNLVPVEPELLEDRALIYLKDYSENEGMLDLLVAEGIVERTGHTRQSGYIEAPLVRIIDPELVAEINQQGQVCVDCNREADELNSEGRCDDCEAQLDEWEEERKRDGYMEDSPTIEDQHPAYGEHMAEASTSAWDKYWGSKKQS